MTDAEQDELASQGMKEYYEFISEHNDKISASIEKLLAEKDKYFHDDFDLLIADINVTNPIEIVDKAYGDDQEEEYKSFSQVLINQRTGYLGDDFSGEIFAKMLDGRWLKITYEC